MIFFSFFSFRSDQTMKNIQRSIDRIEKIIIDSGDWISTPIFLLLNLTSGG